LPPNCTVEMKRFRRRQKIIERFLATEISNFGFQLLHNYLTNGSKN
jgi:hypothetical protein